MLNSNLQSTRESVFMEPILRPGTRIANTSRILYARKEFLRAYGGGVIERVVVGPGSLSEVSPWGMDGIEGYEDCAVD